MATSFRLKTVASLVALCAAMTCSVVGQTGTISPDVDNGNGVTSAGMNNDGKTHDFHADLFTGRFMYEIPIKVPPGRQGSEPKIAVGYNSSGGNGQCGMGWSLNLGYIQRETRYGVPVLWSQTNALCQYDDSKGFVANLGGSLSQLVLVSATNANPLIYRQKVDATFLTYYFYQTDNYWKVVDKGGTEFYFGQGATNRMDNLKTNWTVGAASSTFRWALDESVDPNGNLTTFSYTNDSGALYPQRISYNGNTNNPSLPLDTVDFILTNRTDTNFTFVSNYKVTTQKTISEIQVKANGANVCKYVLTYSNSPCTMRSLLASVTEYGSDFASHLPPVSFQYQVEQVGTYVTTTWTNVTAQAQRINTVHYDYIRAYNVGSGLADGYVVDTVDIDGDGLPDRVMRVFNGGPRTQFIVQRNTGAGFAPEVGWGPICSSNYTSPAWQSPLHVNGSADTTVELFDLNGDGFPDLLESQQSSPYNSFVVQLNNGISGSNGFALTNFWPITNYDSTDLKFLSLRYADICELFDMNGDGLPDRISRNVNAPFDSFKVELNTGTNFLAPADWGPLESQGVTSSDWNSIYKSDNDGIDNHTYLSVTMADINGDGLPDRVMRDRGDSTQFVVQYNNGAGFETNDEYWGPVETLGHPTSPAWGSPVCTTTSAGSAGTAQLLDVNGDGLLDRVVGVTDPVFVQLNTGSGFGPTNTILNLQTGEADGGIAIESFDINGDGLPDRIFCPTSFDTSTNATNWTVQLAAGPFPDLLCTVSNGLGGCTEISYVPSTQWNNRDRDWTNDPSIEGAKSLLSSVVYTVSQLKTFDGLGNCSTNTYSYKGGYYNFPDREFRGFAQVIATDPLGTKTVTYFHQSGGRDYSAMGEYLDQGSFAKHGIPYRVEVIGNDGLTNSITLNKVEELQLNANGWYFPFVSQTIAMNYEGLNSYRATAKQLTYDTNNGNLTAEVSLGEVAGVNAASQSCSDVGNDSVYTWITYTNLGEIVDKPSDVEITSDSGQSNRLREKRMYYDARGNLTNTLAWLDTAGGFVGTGSAGYDQYGNLTSSTDAAGITTATTYDSVAEQFPTTQTTGTFTNTTVFDPASGQLVMAIDAKGLVASNSFDLFFRKTGAYISTNQNGSPNLWVAKIGYLLGGVVGGISSNCIHVQENDGIDSVNGHETYTYSDGLGRSIQVRSEAENGQFRVVNSYYDLRGNPVFATLPYFDSGTNFVSVTGTNLGTFTEYDPIGRAYRVTPSEVGTITGGILSSVTPTGGDTGSPVGPVTTAFTDGTDPWATVVTDANGRTKKAFKDAYGRGTNVVDVTSSGTVNISYSYDLVGNLTNMTDTVGNKTLSSFDSFGRKTQMVDPDMGTWSYQYDNAGRLTQQIDARTNKIILSYSDEIGRITSKQIYNVSNVLAGTITYTYDVSDDQANFPVFKGQLYKITDRQGYERHSYDLRGRELKTGRFLSVNAMEYVTAATYDDADQLKQLTYPGNAAVIQYSYNTLGNIVTTQSTSGTDTNEVFYTAQGFNAVGQLTGWVDGSGSVTTNSFFDNSKRLKSVAVNNGANQLQSLAYTYDKADNVMGVTDGVYSGTKSASLSSIVYDGFYRVTSLNSTARGTKTYTYDSIGNILTNSDFGPAGYQYGSRPHAVTSANGVSYQYDPCGNMTVRGSQVLTYDEENQLAEVSSTNDAVLFGYDYGGERLWRAGTNGYSIWIGGLYEINNGKILCHVYAGGQLIASFEPQCTAGLGMVLGAKRWYAAASGFRRAMDWPFQNGRSRWSMLLAAWSSILGICFAAGRKVKVKACQWRRMLRPRALCRLGLTALCVSSVLFGSINVAEAATYVPVFYYYHTDVLGSSNILTDRAGNLVQHYEYTTFGQNAYTDNSSAFPVSNRYTGQIADDETGLYYYGARYYDPQLGRFIQADTLIPDATDEQSLNRYSYCRNNPLNATDPSGHDDDQMSGTVQTPLQIIQNSQYLNGPDNKNSGIKLDTGLENLGNDLENALLKLKEGASRLFSGSPGAGFSNINSWHSGTSPGQLYRSEPVFFAYDPNAWTHVSSHLNSYSPPPITAQLSHIPTADEKMADLTLSQVGGNFPGTPLGRAMAVNNAADIMMAPGTAMVGEWFSPAAGTALKDGSFSIVDWGNYPAGVPKPTGPFRLIEGAEYNTARAAANQANNEIRFQQGLRGQFVDIHEIQPVKFGGSAVDPANKIILDRALHRQQVTPWWNQLQSDLTGD